MYGTHAPPEHYDIWSVNERALCILLECILVQSCLHSTDSKIEFKLEIVKTDGSTLEDVHRNVTDILEEAPPSVNKRTKTRARSGSDTYRVTVGSASDVKTRLTSKFCLNICVKCKRQ